MFCTVFQANKVSDAISLTDHPNDIVSAIVNADLIKFLLCNLVSNLLSLRYPIRRIPHLIESVTSVRNSMLKCSEAVNGAIVPPRKQLVATRISGQVRQVHVWEGYESCPASHQLLHKASNSDGLESSAARALPRLAPSLWSATWYSLPKSCPLKVPIRYYHRIFARKNAACFSL